MASRVRRRTLAERDLVEHFIYLAENAGVETAKRFLEAAESTFQQLARMPEMGARRTFRNPRFKGMRKWQVRGFENYQPVAEVQCLPSVTVTFFRVTVISITYGRVPARKKADCHQSTLLPRAASTTVL